MDISWCMNQDAIFKALQGKDGWGEPTYYPPVPVKVRWQFSQRLVRGKDGQEVMSEAQVWAPLSITPKADDVMTYQGKDYQIINAGLPTDIHGVNSHWMLFCVTLAN